MLAILVNTSHISIKVASILGNVLYILSLSDQGGIDGGFYLYEHAVLPFNIFVNFTHFKALLVKKKKPVSVL